MYVCMCVACPSHQRYTDDGIHGQCRSAADATKKRKPGQLHPGHKLKTAVCAEMKFINCTCNSNELKACPSHQRYTDEGIDGQCRSAADATKARKSGQLHAGQKLTTAVCTLTYLTAHARSHELKACPSHQRYADDGINGQCKSAPDCIKARKSGQLHAGHKLRTAVCTADAMGQNHRRPDVHPQQRTKATTRKGTSKGKNSARTTAILTAWSQPAQRRLDKRR